MQEEDLFSQGVHYSISQHIVKYKKRILMIPFGYPFNFDLMEKLAPGDLICMGNGSLIKVTYKAIINTRSSAAEVLSWALYGKPMEDVIQEFSDRYGADNIQDEEIIVIAYDTIE